MSKKKNKIVLNELNFLDLNKMVSELKKKLFFLRVTHSLKSEKDTSVFSKIKKDIARVMTEISIRKSREEK